MVSVVDSILSAAGFTPDQIQQVYEGALVKEVAAARHDRELGVKLSCLVKRPVETMKHNFMTGNPLKKADPAVVGMGVIDEENPDFSMVKLDDAMIEAYLNAAPGTLLNLSKTEIEAFQAVKEQGGSGELVEEVFRRILVDRYRSYHEKGLAGIQPYTRARGKEHFPGDDIIQSNELNTILKKEYPLFQGVLKDYPQSRPENLEEAYFWLSNLIEGKTTVSLVHQLGMMDGKDYLFAERQFYVSRSYNSVQGIGGAFPVENGTVVIYSTRTSTDQVAGFGGSVKKAIGAKILGSKVAENFERARQNASSS